MGERLMTYDQLVDEMRFSNEVIAFFLIMLFFVWLIMDFRFSCIEHRWRREEHEKHMEQLSERSDDEK